MTSALVILVALLTADSPTYGAAANPTGDPIGGGEGYRRVLQPTRADHAVRTKAEFLQALSTAKPGEIIYVDDHADIDLTDHKEKLAVPCGVTVGSGRGRNGSPGALIFTKDLGRMPLLLIGGDHVRITGMRLRGPDTQTRESAYVLPNLHFGRSRGERNQVLEERP